MEDKKIIYIDMDGVIADFDLAIKEFAKTHPFKSEDPDQDHVEFLCKQNPDIFHNLKPIKDSIESVVFLMNFFNVYFLSTPMWELPESFTGKRIWIEKHFGEFGKKRLILTHRKDLNIGEYLIDDRTKNGAGEFKGKHIHFGTEQFPDWVSVKKYLMRKEFSLEL